MCKVCKAESEGRLCQSCINKRDVEAYAFKCKDCSGTFIVDGLYLYRLQLKYPNSYKNPSKCDDCKMRDIII